MAPGTRNAIESGISSALIATGGAGNREPSGGAVLGQRHCGRRRRRQAKPGSSPGSRSTRRSSARRAGAARWQPSSTRSCARTRRARHGRATSTSGTCCAGATHAHDESARGRCRCSPRTSTASTTRSRASSTTSRPPRPAPRSAAGCCCCSGRRPAASRRWSSCSSAALEEYSHTDEGALYARARLPGARIAAAPGAASRCGRSSARPTASTSTASCARRAAMRLEHEFGGDFMRMPVERIFISEAGRVGIGTYAPHDPTTADLADLVGSVDLSQGGGVRRRRATRAPGRGRAPSTPRAAACSR